MKLPGYERTGVESLGRNDLSGPGQVWRSKQQADASLNKAIGAVADVAVEIFSAQDETENLQLLQERILQDKANNSMLEAYLTETPVIDLDDENVPEPVREYATQWLDLNAKEGDDLTRVDTHKIIDGFMMQNYRSSVDASLTALKGTDLESKYLNSMDEQITSGIGNTMRTKVKQRQASIKAKADTRYNEALNSLDETQARIIAAENLESGAWTPDVYSEHVDVIGPTMDYLQFQQSIANAKTQEDLDSAQASIVNSRMTPEQKGKAFGQFNSATDSIRSRLDYSAYQDGVNLLMNNQLTEGWISDQLSNQKISGGHAVALKNALDDPSPLNSDPLVVDRFRGEIAMLGTTDEDNMSTDLRVATLEEGLKKAYYGIDASGNYTGKQMTGEDYLKLANELRDAKNKALGKGGQQYQSATGLIRSVTGYTDMFSSLKGSSPQRMAYSSFKQGLDTWMQYNPGGNPQEWVHQNAHLYDPKKFGTKYKQRLQSIFPEFSSEFEMDEQGNVANAGKIIMDAAQDPDYPASRYKMLESELQYNFLGIGTGKYYESSQDENSPTSGKSR